LPGCPTSDRAGTDEDCTHQARPGLPKIRTGKLPPTPPLGRSATGAPQADNERHQACGPEGKQSPAKSSHEGTISRN
jgi:hypothetical protein